MTFTHRRIVIGIALAAVTLGAPVAMITATPERVSLADCDSGEEMDTFTTTCTPFLVPNSPSPQGFTSTAANPDIPEIDGVPCTGRDSGACIGLAEDQPGPEVTPKVTIDSSP